MKRVGVFNWVGVGPSLDYAAYAQLIFESHRNFISKVGHCSPYLEGCPEDEMRTSGESPLLSFQAPG